MRTIIGLCTLTLVLIAGLIWHFTKSPTQFGSFSNAPQAAVLDVIERPKDFLDKTVLLEGLVRQQCTSMGCFFFLRAGEKALRVDLEAIAMTAPMREGRPVRVEGLLAPYGDGYQFVASAVEFN